MFRIVVFHGVAQILFRLALAQIIFLAIHKHHHIGVLLNRARLAQVSQIWPFVLALFDGAGKLREG